MGWVKLDDEFVEHRKVDALPDGAFRLHVAAMCHAARALTDGFVPEDRPPRLMRKYRKSYVTDLIAAGLWETADGGWMIHDYLEYNPSASDELERRRKDRERKAKERAKGTKNVGRGDDGRFQSESDAESHRDGPPDGDEESAPPSTATRTPTPTSSKSSSGEPLGVEPVEEEDRMTETCRLVAERRCERQVAAGKHVGHRSKWVAAVAAGAANEVREHYSRFPDDTPGVAAAFLEPDPSPPPPKPTDHLEGTARSQMERAERGNRQVAGEACPECSDSGVTLDDSGTARACACPAGKRVAV